MTQIENVREHLKTKSITAIEALNLYGVFRLAHLIFMLRKEMPINSEVIRPKVGNHYTRYSR